MNTGISRTTDRDVRLRPCVRSANPTAASSLLTSLVSYWDFNETRGVRVDKLGVNSLANVSVDPGYTSGKLGNALTVGNVRVLSHSGLQFGAGSFTIAGWVKFTALSGTVGVVTKSNASGDRQFELQWNSGISRLRFGISSTSTATLVALADATNFGALSTGTWYFVCCWYDATAGQIGIQVNATTPNTAAHTLGSYAGTQALVFGAFSESLQMSGYLDEWGLWSRALTSTERSELYNSGNGKTYPFS